MSTRVSVLVAITAIVAVATASAPAAAASGFQVVRVEDTTMTCEAMVSEINDLNAEVQRQADNARRGAQARQAAGRLGRGLLSGLAQGAQSMVYSGGSTEALTQSVASNAIAGVASEIANGAAGAPAPAPATDAPVTSQSQRLDHLNGLYAARC